MTNDIRLTVTPVKQIDVTVGEDHLNVYTTVERISVTDLKKIQAILTAAELARDESAQHAEWASNRASAALVSQNAAKVSETQAKASETASKASEEAALVSQVASQASAVAAKTSETNAKTSEQASHASEVAAKASETHAKSSETASKTSETNAARSEQLADDHARLAEQWAQNPQGTPVEPGEYSSLHWAAVAKGYADTMGNALVFKGGWDASGGTLPPTPTTPTADFYKITGAGTLGGVRYEPGDSMVWNPTDSTWLKIEGTERPISDSVNLDSSTTVASSKAVADLNALKLDTTGKAPTAGTADRWANERLITLSGDASGNVGLDGSSDVTLPVTVADNSHAHTVANVTGLQATLDGKPGEAPTDGQQYARKNNAWARITADVEEAPIDGEQYVRKDAAWAHLTADVEEAPEDGKIYFRSDGQWKAADDTFIAAAPVGLSAMWYGEVPPAGWLEEDGSEIDKAQHPVLWQMFLGVDNRVPFLYDIKTTNFNYQSSWVNGVTTNAIACDRSILTDILVGKYIESGGSVKRITAVSPSNNPPCVVVEHVSGPTDNNAFKAPAQWDIHDRPFNPNKAYLPESRGELPRGWDHGRGVDEGRELGSGQGDAFEEHTHRIKLLNNDASGNVYTGYPAGAGEINTGVVEGSTTTVAGNGNETRPRNTARMFIIKAVQPPRSIDAIRSYRSQEYTATDGQASFPFAYDPGNNALNVIQNGSHLSPSAYAATNGTAVVLNTPAKAGDTLLITDLSSVVLNDMAPVSRVAAIESDVAQLSNPNLLINGDFSVWQEGNSHVANGVLTYTADGWLAARCTNNATVINVNGAILPAMYISSPNAAGYVSVRQRIEAGHTLKGRELTLSFYLHGTTNTVDAESTITYKNENGTYNNIPYLFRQGFNTFTFTSPTDGNNDDYLEVSLQFAGVSGGSVLVHLANAKLELGNKATPFIPDDPATNLAKCQRYFQTANNVLKMADGVTYNGMNYTYPVPMRVTPTVVRVSNGNFTAHTAETIVSGINAASMNLHKTLSESYVGRIGGSFTLDARL